MTERPVKGSWERYEAASAYDELMTPAGKPRAAARRIVNLLRKFSPEEFAARQEAADLSIREMGISFTVYSESGNIDRAWPFDLIPRVIRARDWNQVSAGLKQRSVALNRFIDDIYNRQKVLADGVVPAELIEN